MFARLINKLRNPICVIAMSFGFLPFMTPKTQPIVFTFDKTINFCEPGAKWPVEKLFTPAEREVYAQRGKPDYFHILWTPEGDIRLRAITDQEWQKSGPENMPKLAWVYARSGEQIFFANNGYQAQPLNDAELLVIKYGDPESNRELGNGVVEWTYYSIGKLYTISGNKVVGTRDFPPMGSFHK